MRLNLIPLLITSLLIFGFPAASTAADAGATEKKVRQLQVDIRKLEARLRQFRGESQSIESKLRSSEVQAGRLSKAIRTGEQKVANSRRELKRLTLEKERLDHERENQARELSQQLAAAYRIGHQDQIKLLLNQQQPERLSRILRYYEYMNRARIRAIDEYQTTLISLEQTEAGIRAETSGLEQKQQALKADAEKLRSSRSQRKQALTQLQKKISGGDARLKRLKADRERLKTLLKQLQQSLEKIDLAWDSKEFRQLKGRLKWPTKGKVIRNFGSRNRQGVKSEGMLISAPAGNRVRAVHHGRVVFADWLRGFGLLLIIDHGSGYMSLYGHNRSLLKDVGDWVSGNEIIATVGDSGGLSETGLYFAIRYKGQPYNPKPWLSKRRG